ncbi:MAG: RNA-guided endonuclease InsQ/TnpB family protein [Candidatus Ranarchaeia archaeon]
MCNNKYITNRILKIHRKRNNRVRDYFHKISRVIINYCIKHDIDRIVIGYNKSWKQNINLGKKNNQNFVEIPFHKFVKQVEYKDELVKIIVIRSTEEFTSQTCSDCGIVNNSNRKYRGLYVCSRYGSVLNSDVNASINIIRKGVPESKFTWIGDRGLLSRPVVLKIS